MKKLLSLVLAVVLVVGLSSVAFGAASGRITGAVKAIDTNLPNPPGVDFDNLRPNTIIEYPLTADMFIWSGTAGDANEPVTRAQINAASVRTSHSGSGSSAIDSHSIVYKTSAVTGGKETAHVRVVFMKELQSTSDIKFRLSLFLQMGSRQPDSLLQLSGTLANKQEEVYPGDDYVSIEHGETLLAKGFIRNLEIYIGNDVTVKTNVFQDQKYYGTTSNSPKAEDDKVLNKYGDITDIIYLNTINLNKAGTTVSLDYSGRHVYNSKGEYLGTTSKAVPYSVKYYLTTKNIGNTIDVTGSGSGGTTPPVTPPPTIPIQPPTDPIVPETGEIVNRASGVMRAEEAIKKSTTSVAIVTYKNFGGINALALQGMAATGKAANKTIQINADSTVGNTVIGRLTINPALASKLTADTKFGVYTDNDKTRITSAHFNKWYKNNMAFVSLDQKGSFGMNVNVAVKVDLSGLNTKNLRLYSFNSSTNKFAEITGANIWIDANGYLRFTTSSAGEIVISDGALARK